MYEAHDTTLAGLLAAIARESVVVRTLGFGVPQLTQFGQEVTVMPETLYLRSLPAFERNMQNLAQSCALKGVPVLFFFNGVHEDYHEPSDEPHKVNALKESRILRLVFYLGTEVANAAARPRWNPESFREIVEE